MEWSRRCDIFLVMKLIRIIWDGKKWRKKDVWSLIKVKGNTFKLIKDWEQIKKEYKKKLKETEENEIKNKEKQKTLVDKNIFFMTKMKNLTREMS